MPGTHVFDFVNNYGFVVVSCVGYDLPNDICLTSVTRAKPKEKMEFPA